jgi:hypothetical protein
MAVEVDTAIPAGTALLIGGGSDGTNARYIKVDSSGNQVMIGLGAAGSPAGGVLSIQGVGGGTPVPVSGTVTANAGSGNFSVVQATAANLNATVIGTVTSNIGTTGGLALETTLSKLTITPGAAIGSNTLAMIGGHVTTTSPTYTNGNINPLSLTTAGALRVDASNVVHPVSQSGTWTVQQGTPPWSVIGPAANGDALSGNPVRVAGSDGANTRNILTDTSGRIVIIGAGAANAALTGNPVLIGESDGTNLQIPRVFDLDTGAGSQYVSGLNLRFSASGGSVEAGTSLNPINITGTVITSETGGTSPTFYVIFDRIIPGNNKYMATLFNTSSTKKIVVYKISRYNWQVAAVNGQTLEQYLTKISARTAGTAATIYPSDSSDILPAGITAHTNSTGVTETNLIRRFFASSEEANLSNSNFYNALSLDYSVAIYERVVGTRGLVLRQNEGIAIRNVTNSTVGTVSYAFEFVVEDV